MRGGKRGFRERDTKPTLVGGHTGLSPPGRGAKARKEKKSERRGLYLPNTPELENTRVVLDAAGCFCTFLASPAAA